MLLHVQLHLLTYKEALGTFTGLRRYTTIARWQHIGVTRKWIWGVRCMQFNPACRPIYKQKRFPPWGRGKPGCVPGGGPQVRRPTAAPTGLKDPYHALRGTLGWGLSWRAVSTFVPRAGEGRGQIMISTRPPHPPPARPQRAILRPTGSWDLTTHTRTHIYIDIYIHIHTHIRTRTRTRTHTRP